MGFFDFIKKKNTNNMDYAPSLSGYAPLFSQFGQNVFVSDVVLQAIQCIVSEMKKLQPKHVRADEISGDVSIVSDGSLRTVLQQPNKLMTTSDFLEKVCWQLFFNFNSFIIPMWDETKNGRRYRALWPVQPTQVNFFEDRAGVIFVELVFVNDYKVMLPYSDVIHIRYRYSVSDYMGGDGQGQPGHAAILKTLELNDTLLQGVSKAIKSSFSINGVVKYHSMIDPNKTKKEIRKLEKLLNENESGFLPLDMKSEYTPMKKDIKLVDEATLKFIDEKILRHFGVSLPILTGDYTKSQYEAFYQKTLEPLIKSFGEAFTKTLFTAGEKSYGNKVNFYSKDLIFMTMSEKMEFVNILSPSGALYQNEIRQIFGLLPMEELNGVRMQSLNWINADRAGEYQVGSAAKQKEEDLEDE